MAPPFMLRSDIVGGLDKVNIIDGVFAKVKEGGDEYEVMGLPDSGHCCASFRADRRCGAL